MPYLKKAELGKLHTEVYEEGYQDGYAEGRADARTMYKDLEKATDFNIRVKDANLRMFKKILDRPHERHRIIRARRTENVRRRLRRNGLRQH